MNASSGSIIYQTHRKVLLFEYRFLYIGKFVTFADHALYSHDRVSLFIVFIVDIKNCKIGILLRTSEYEKVCPRSRTSEWREHPMEEHG